MGSALREALCNAAQRCWARGIYLRMEHHANIAGHPRCRHEALTQQFWLDHAFCAIVDGNSYGEFEQVSIFTDHRVTRYTVVPDARQPNKLPERICRAMMWRRVAGCRKYPMSRSGCGAQRVAVIFVLRWCEEASRPEGSLHHGNALANVGMLIVVAPFGTKFTPHLPRVHVHRMAQAMLAKLDEIGVRCAQAAKPVRAVIGQVERDDLIADWKSRSEECLNKPLKRRGACADIVTANEIARGNHGTGLTPQSVRSMFSRTKMVDHDPPSRHKAI